MATQQDYVRAARQAAVIMENLTCSNEETGKLPAGGSLQNGISMVLHLEWQSMLGTFVNRALTEGVPGPSVASLCKCGRPCRPCQGQTTAWRSCGHCSGSVSIVVAASELLESRP